MKNIKINWIHGLLAALLTISGLISPPAMSETTADDGPEKIGNVYFVDDLTNIPADLAVMKAKKIPMMLFFHASYCGYCQMVDRQFLIPMRVDPEFMGRLLIRRVQIDADTHYIGRDGKSHDYIHLTKKLGVRGVPYILFVAPDGSRITSIQGTAMDFYGYYLSKDTDLATHCAKQPKQAHCDGSKGGAGL